MARSAKSGKSGQSRRSGNWSGGRGTPRDPVEVALFAQLLATVAEEMGVALRRSAFSPNIKERRDYSCAVFLADGTVAAQAAHIPVHLGSAPLSVKAVIQDLDLQPGDEAVLNDPFRGGTHLPDVTVVRPVFLSVSAKGPRRPDLFVANRAHHADIGGAWPGSMGIVPDVHGEGFRIPPVHLRREGAWVGEVLKLFRAQVRQPDEREGDLRAQSSANHVGETRLTELARERGVDALLRGIESLPDATERAMSAVISKLPRGTLRHSDVVEDDGLGSGPLNITVAIRLKGGRAVVDFTGTAPQTRGPVNANFAVTLSATAYAFRCLLDEDVPGNGGIFRVLDVIAPAGCLVNAQEPAAVAGGNVETSQRIVDVVLGALAAAAPERIPAASCGTMSNLTLGGEGFTYYETIGGGSGAGVDVDGASAVQTHMTNTRNTPIEMLERDCPVRVEEYAVRRGSGGGGRTRGGDGIRRVVRVLDEVTFSLLADRHQHGAPGRDGGRNGRPGRAWRVRADGRRRRVTSKSSGRLDAGEALVIETPGGGGMGTGRVTRRRGR